MAEKSRPLSKKEAPDTARVYERAKPEHEAGMGKLHTPKPPIHKTPDNPPVPNAKKDSRKQN